MSDGDDIRGKAGDASSLAVCPQCGARDAMGCVGAPGHECFLVLARPLFAEVERLRSAIDDAIFALGPGDDEDSDSPGNLAFAILINARSAHRGVSSECSGGQS